MKATWVSLLLTLLISSIHLFAAEQSPILPLNFAGWQMKGAAKASTDPVIADAANVLGTYDTFTVEVKGAKGAALTMERSLPARIDTVMDLK
jgi:archaellin